MAAEYGTVYYEKNVLPGIELWTRGSGAELKDSGEEDSQYRYHVELAPNSYIETELNDEINNALHASKFRQLIMGLYSLDIENNVDGREKYNYGNIIELRQELVYTDFNGNTTDCSNITPYMYYGTNLISEDYHIRELRYEITMLNQTIKEGKVRLENNSNQPVWAYYIIIYRSNDLIGQLENVGEDGEEEGGEGGGPIEGGTKLEITTNPESGTIDTINDVLELMVSCPKSYGSFNILSQNDIRFEFVDGYPSARVYWTSTQYIKYENDKNYFIKFLLRGARNGIVKATYTLSSAGIHAGEWVEKEISIINCNRGSLDLRYVNAKEVSGFDGTVVTIGMNPYPWYTDVVNQYNSGQSGLVDTVYTLFQIERGISLDGGFFSLDRLTNKSEGGKLDGLESAFSIYGVWNGRQVLQIKELGYVDRETNSQNVVVTVVNCDHILELIAVQDTITQKDQQIQLELRTVPENAPCIFTSNVSSPYSWRTDNTHLRVAQYLGSYGSHIMGIMLGVNGNMVDGEYDVSVNAGTAYNVYETLSTKVTIASGEEGGGSTYKLALANAAGGTNLINTFGGEIVLKIVTDIPDATIPTYRLTQLAKSGGGYVRITEGGGTGSNRLYTIKGIWDGIVTLLLTEEKSGSSALLDVVITNNNSYAYRLAASNYIAEDTIPNGTQYITFWLQGVNEDGTDNELDNRVKYFNYNYALVKNNPITNWNRGNRTFPNNAFEVATAGTSTTGTVLINMVNPANGQMIVSKEINVARAT